MSTLKTATRTPAIPRHRVVGLAVVLLAVLVVVLLAWRPDPFGSTRRAQAVFRDTGTLGPLEVEVRVAGTPVGRVVGQRRLGVATRLTRDGAAAARALQGNHREELSGAIRELAATTAGVARDERSLGSLL